MKRDVVLPAWLSVLSLAVALFFPLGGALISDSYADADSRHRGAAHAGKSKHAPAEVRGEVPADQTGRRQSRLRV